MNGHLRKRICLAGALAISLFVICASAASASFQDIRIREVHRSPAGTGDYVVLQMTADGSNAIAGKHVVSYDNAGNVYSNMAIPTNVPNGQSQRTILIANSPTVSPSPDVVNLGWGIFGPDGSVCLTDTMISVGVDCVAYGTTAPPAGPPSPVGTPFDFMGAGLPLGQSITRTIAPGCATLLEAGDDRNNSAIDFARSAPNPRNNATTPVERSCSATAGGQQKPRKK
jgi:hypothetical protein